MILDKKCRFGWGVDCIAILKEQLLDVEQTLLFKLGFLIAVPRQNR